MPAEERQLPEEELRAGDRRCVRRRADGKSKWMFKTKGNVDSSPVVAGERVYVGSRDGHLYVLDLIKGVEVQKLKLGRAVTASPAVSDGCLVIGSSDGTLYCLGAKGKKTSSTISPRRAGYVEPQAEPIVSRQYWLLPGCLMLFLPALPLALCVRRR